MKTWCKQVGRSAFAATLLLSLSSCWSGREREVVVYTALDREYSEPLLQQFARETGIKVRAKYDVESTKTVGLVNAIIEERERPRCDLFWNNEILHSLRLKRLGLLEVYATAAGASFPAQYRSPDHDWYGIAARARILVVNTQLLPNEADWPRSIFALASPKWHGRCAIAKPLFGTTATHAAVLFEKLGDGAARDLFRGIAAHARVLSGNRQVAAAVARGEFAFGLTDTDDAIKELDKGLPVAIVVPDQGKSEIGALLIPNTLCLLKGSAHPELARQLLEFLLRPEVESQLASGPSAQFPLRRGVHARSRVPIPASTRWMDVDFPAAADAWERAFEFLIATFQSPQ